MKPAFDIKSARLDALAIQLNTAEEAAIRRTLNERAAQYAELSDMPLLLDIQAFSEPGDLDLDAILGLFAEHGLPIGTLRHRGEAWQTLAREHHLAFCEEGISNSEEPKEAGRLPEKRPAETPAAPQPGNRKTLVVEKPIRTGQQVYAENADLIVLGLVSEGAEVIADGHIHVYAPLRGRALAGANGEHSARIFAQSMQAELVSIAGIYRTFDQQLPPHLHRQAVQIYLQKERLAIAALSDMI
ncbi:MULTISPECIES: septum site-determining protein MinC [Eikenella]|uniref:Probable septum site-determining protein MinC n=1 Tax=Eikenella longinqua TaxID=1795827 RepID=A0A1A9RT73_9NEIS|nr:MULTISPECIES: septum site-determining protein MinC [Eikenella]OAM25834.1 septum site-determining protein MinC [Eikenella longinqua]